MIGKVNREELIKKVSGSSVDVVVIGGGVTGSGILRELTRVGLKGLLLEQKDFAWGTSSRSTKMVHGGLRYLKEGDIGLTRESVLERENLINELPGLVENRSFILPYYKDKLLSRWIMHLGLIVYDVLSGKWRRHVCPADEVKEKAPYLKQKDLRGGFLINDAVTDDARLTLRVLTEAVNNGAQAINYCRVDELCKENQQVNGVRFQDLETGEMHQVKARLVINATGAWADRLRSSVTRKNKQRIRPLRGSHVVLSAERLPLGENISIMHPDDGRPVTTLNWEGRVVMGTTDIDHKEDMNMEASISKEEVKYLLNVLNYLFPELNLTTEDIISTQAGIRPVIDTGKENPSQESRDHAIWVEDGLLTVTGGKLTTFRVIALDTLKAAGKILGESLKLKKQRLFAETDASVLKGLNLSTADAKRLVGRYGSASADVAGGAKDGELEQIPGTHTLWGELRWTAKHEMVVHLDDLLLRRTRLGLLLKEGGAEVMPKIKDLCQQELGWEDAKWEEEEKRYLALWKQHYSVPSLSE